MSDRKQRVVLGNEKSGWKPVTSGIPQGSVLGPILFIIFINDMPKVVKSYMKLFADDAKIYKAIESVENISMIQHDIDKLLMWSEKWQLPLNISKCKVLHYGTKNPNHLYKMGNQPLSSDVSEKDVGVTFDLQLNFKLHIRNMVAKANSRVGIIKRSFSCLNKKNFLLLYKSLVRPILEYCSSVWNPLYKNEALEIEKVQRRATKLVPNLRNLNYEDRLRALNITTLFFRRKRADVIQVYRLLHKIDKIDYKQFFTRNENPTRGNGWKLFKPYHGANIRANNFSNRVINDWNSLSRKTVDADTINAFKSALEKEWANKPYKYIYE